MVSIRGKFCIIVLVSNQIEYWSNYWIWFQILNIRTASYDTIETFNMDSKAECSA